MCVCVLYLTFYLLQKKLKVTSVHFSVEFSFLIYPCFRLSLTHFLVIFKLEKWWTQCLLCKARIDSTDTKSAFFDGGRNTVFASPPAKQNSLCGHIMGVWTSASVVLGSLWFNSHTCSCSVSIRLICTPVVLKKYICYYWHLFCSYKCKFFSFGSFGAGLQFWIEIWICACRDQAFWVEISQWNV